jgi:hypothetical protein
MVMSFHIIFAAVFLLLKAVLFTSLRCVLSQMTDFHTTTAKPCGIPVVDEACFVAWQVTGKHIVMFDRHASQG